MGAGDVDLGETYRGGSPFMSLCGLTQCVRDARGGRFTRFANVRLGWGCGESEGEEERGGGEEGGVWVVEWKGDGG